MFNPELCFFGARAGTLPKISWSTFVWLHHEQGSCSPNDWSAQHARQRWAYSNLRAKLLCQWPSVPGPQRLFSWVCQWGWEDMGRHSRLFDTGTIDPERIDLSNQQRVSSCTLVAAICESGLLELWGSKSHAHHQWRRMSQDPPETEKQQQRQQKTTHVVPPCKFLPSAGWYCNMLRGITLLVWYQI